MIFVTQYVGNNGRCLALLVYHIILHQINLLYATLKIPTVIHVNELIKCQHFANIYKFTVTLYQTD